MFEFRAKIIRTTFVDIIPNPELLLLCPLSITLAARG